MSKLIKGLYYITSEHYTGEAKVIKGFDGPINFVSLDNAKEYADSWSRSKGSICMVRPALNTRSLGPACYSSNNTLI